MLVKQSIVKVIFLINTTNYIMKLFHKIKPSVIYVQLQFLEKDKYSIEHNNVCSGIPHSIKTPVTRFQEAHSRTNDTYPVTTKKGQDILGV